MKVVRRNKSHSVSPKKERKVVFVGTARTVKNESDVASNTQVSVRDEEFH